MKNWLTPLLLAVSLLGLTSCSNTSEVIARGLKLELTHVELGRDGVIQVTWQVNNPNVVSYLVDHSVQKITLDGVFVGTLTDAVRLGVAAQSKVGRTTMLMPANAQAADLVAQLAAKGSAHYQIDAAVSLLLYDDEKTKADVGGEGSVPVTTK